MSKDMHDCVVEITYRFFVQKQARSIVESAYIGFELDQHKPDLECMTLTTKEFFCFQPLDSIFSLQLAAVFMDFMKF